MPITWRFSINGTNGNEYSRYGLRFNPFPQHGQSELNRADLALQSLAAPMDNAGEIRKRLAGVFSNEFIDHIVEMFQPGKVVDIQLTMTRTPQDPEHQYHVDIKHRIREVA